MRRVPYSIIKTVLLLFFILCFSCDKKDLEKGKSESSDAKKPETTIAPALKYTLDNFSGECWECYQERIESDSLIQHFITYYNNEPFKPSSGYGHIGCKHYIPKSEEAYYNAVEILMHAIHDTTLGTGVRSGLMKDLTWITAFRIRHPNHDHTFPDLSIDSVEAYLLDKWDRWWEENRERTVVEWNIAALKQTASNYSRSIAIENLAAIGDSANVADPLFEALDTIEFEYHGNLNSQIIPVLAGFKERRIIPFLIRYYLQNDYKYLRQDGEKYIKEVTGKTLGYSATAPYSQRKEAIKRWWSYWRKER